MTIPLGANDHFGRGLSAREKRAVAEAKGAAAKCLIASGALRAVDGAADFVRSARARGLPCAMASTSEIAAFAVDALGIGDLFECVCAKRRDERPKPYPDVFSRALRMLGMPAHSWLVIEDTAIGARAARCAGAQAILRATDDAGAGELAPGDVLGSFRTYAELHAGLGWGRMGDASR